MAKRKAAGTTRRKTVRKSAGAGRNRAAQKAPRRKSGAKKTAKKTKSTARKKTAAAARTRSAAARPPRRATATRARARARAVAPKRSPKTASPRKAVAQKPAAPRKAVQKPASTRKVVARRTRAVVARKAVFPRSGGAIAVRKPPALDRARRIVLDDDIVQTPPSSLNMDRTASAARSGRRELLERLGEHNETGPALTAGDIDADWESAYSVGDEAPGGDNPTPDQDVVDDIGKAVGLQYEDNEELKADEKITKRDKHRWELDPASAEDYKEH
jgi:hypothetical protein